LSSPSSEETASANESTSRGLIKAPRELRPPFFFAGEYPVDSRSESCFLEPSRKRSAGPARRGNAGDAEEGGGRRASATLLLVTAVEGASGEGGALDMIHDGNLIFLVRDYFLEVGGMVSSAGKK
jgi:hypothetical protein